MLHQCGHSCVGCVVSKPCSCGFIHGSILFPVSGERPMEEPTNYTIPSSSVDCTLSLGTPSTRQTSHKSSAPIQRSIPTLLLDINSHSSKHTSILGGDPLLLARRCANCDTTSTPLWRNGPRGPKSLCNACGIRYKKEERRAAASPSLSSSAVAAPLAAGYRTPPQHPWSCYASTETAPKSPSVAMYDEFRVITGSADVDDGEGMEAPYLSWRLNVVPTAQFEVRDRPSLFHYQ